jgi:hypothetical protein
MDFDGMEMGTAMQGMGWIRIFGTTSVTGSKTEQDRTASCVEERLRAGTYDDGMAFFCFFFLCVREMR